MARSSAAEAAPRPSAARGDRADGERRLECGEGVGTAQHILVGHGHARQLDDRRGARGVDTRLRADRQARRAGRHERAGRRAAALGEDQQEVGGGARAGRRACARRAATRRLRVRPGTCPCRARLQSLSASSTASATVRSPSARAGNSRAATAVSTRAVGAAWAPTCWARSARPGMPKPSSGSTPTAYHPSSVSSGWSGSTARPSRKARASERGARASSACRATSRSSRWSGVNSRSMRDQPFGRPRMRSAMMFFWICSLPP